MSDRCPLGYLLCYNIDNALFPDALMFVLSENSDKCWSSIWVYFLDLANIFCLETIIELYVEMLVFSIFSVTSYFMNTYY